MMKKIKLIFIRFAHQLLRLYWFVFRPVGRGVKVVLCYKEKVLMVRHNYGHGLWTVPGGGVKDGELLEVAAVREIKEELGIIITSVTHIGTYTSNYEYKQVTVDCYIAKVASEDFQIDNFEIAEGRWFSPEALPDNRASSVDKIMAMLATGR